jgi:hypothetical protein
LADEYEAAKLRWAGGAQRPFWRGNAPKKTGARSAWARTRGQNPLVKYILLIDFPNQIKYLVSISKKGLLQKYVL